MIGLLILAFSVFLVNGLLRKDTNLPVFIGLAISVYLAMFHSPSAAALFLCMSLTFAVSFVMTVHYKLETEKSFFVVLSSVYATAVTFQVLDIYIFKQIPRTYIFIHAVLERFAESLKVLESMQNTSMDMMIKFTDAYAIIKQVLPYLGPYILFLAVIVYTVLALLYVSRYSVLKPVNNIPFRHFAKWIWNDLTVYILIIGWVFYLVGKRIDSTILWVFGLNTKLISEVLFLVQGVAILTFWFKKNKLPTPLRVMFYVPVFIFRPFQVFFSYMGAFDTWFDFRGIKKKEVKKSESHS